MKKVIDTGKALRSLRELHNEKEEVRQELKNIEDSVTNTLLNPQQIAINTGMSALSGLAGTFGALKTGKQQGVTSLLNTTLKIAGKALPLKPLIRIWLKAQLFNTAVFLGKKAGRLIKKKITKAP